MKKKKLIYVLVALVVILAIIAIALGIYFSTREDDSEKKVKELSNERINEINSIMIDKVQAFAESVNKNKYITQAYLDDLKKEIEDEIDLEVEISMEAKVKRENNEKVEFGSSDVAAPEVYVEMDNAAIISEIDSEGKLKLNSSDIISVSVTLKDKKLIKGGEPYASYSTIIY